MIVNNALKEIISDINKNIENMSINELMLLKNEMIKNPNNYELIENSILTKNQKQCIKEGRAI